MEIKMQIIPYRSLENMKLKFVEGQVMLTYDQFKWLVVTKFKSLPIIRFMFFCQHVIGERGLILK